MTEQFAETTTAFQIFLPDQNWIVSTLSDWQVPTFEPDAEFKSNYGLKRGDIVVLRSRTSKLVCVEMHRIFGSTFCEPYPIYEPVGEFEILKAWKDGGKSFKVINVQNVSTVEIIS